MLVRDFVNGITSEIYTQASLFKTASFMNHFSTKIANWLQSKLFTIQFQRRSCHRPKLTWWLDRKR